MDDRALQDRTVTSIRDWLIDEAGFLEHFGLVLEGLCERLIAAGLPLARATSHIRVVHSERIGLTRLWRRGQPTLEQHFGFGPEVEAMYRRSPIRIAHEEKRRVELRPDDPAAAAFGITGDLKALGISHYAIFPLFFTSGQVNAASFATDRPGGFLPAELELIERLLPALARVMEIKGLQRSRARAAADLRRQAARGADSRRPDPARRRGQHGRGDPAVRSAPVHRDGGRAGRGSVRPRAQSLFRLRRAGGHGRRAARS